ncbi:MAG: GTPase ObgE [Candidatus Sericytochromatia bacterium]|nr:GTPase ObgE [Candidatus Tanganyikabacteria bacterium]
MFIDRATIKVTSGAGGDGAVAFRHEKYVAHGGPSGGDGGHGGSVVLVATEDLQTLLDFQYKREFAAQPGKSGGTTNKTGKSGEDLQVRVPCGTVVYDAESGELLADLVDPGETFVAAKGGRGGRGNASFATPTNRAPTTAERGGPAEARALRLELKLLADVGLVGLPNAGKSTLISAVSAARPKIADYPFTTLEPHLGVVRFGEGEHIVLADVPGLIEGAHKGAGLGHEFLRHLERTRVLVHVVDLSGGLEGRDPLEDWRTIERELAQYSPELAGRPRLAAFNKIDLPEAQAHLDRVGAELATQGIPAFPVSAATRQGLDPLLNHLRRLVAETPAPPRFEPAPAAQKPREAGPPFAITRHNDTFVVTGPAVDPLVAGHRLDSVEAAARLERNLTRLGVYEALRSRGVKDGDTVRIGDMEFTYVE